MRAQHLAQRLMQQMRRRMIRPQAGARRVVDLEFDGIAGLQLALDDLAVVNEQALALLARVGDRERTALETDLAMVADLAAGLGVERRLVDDDCGLDAGLQRG